MLGWGEKQVGARALAWEQADSTAADTFTHSFLVSHALPGLEEQSQVSN